VEPHFPTNEDLRHFKALSAPLLSPDGNLVLFTVTEATADGGTSHLWLAPAARSQQKARQITFSPPSDKRGERGAQWAPDGSAIYFLAKRDEHTQLFRLDMRGGEAAPYDLKVLPAVDESKVPGAIPPPGSAAASAANKSSDKKAENESWYDRWYFGKPWEHMDDAWRQGPLSGAAHAKTPFLLLQGQSDATDPLGQSEEMYRALRQAGVPVEMVTYPREDHGPLAVGIFGHPPPEPWHGFDGRQRIVEFIERAFASQAAK